MNKNLIIKMKDGVSSSVCDTFKYPTAQGKLNCQSCKWILSRNFSKYMKCILKNDEIQVKYKFLVMLNPAGLKKWNLLNATCLLIRVFSQQIHWGWRPGRKQE